MSASSEIHLQAGKVLGPYRLLRPLDQRSAIEVWLGQHIHSQEPMALKILCRNSLQEEELQRYEMRLHNEARVLASFRHRHIVGYHDYRLVKHFRYIVMQYAPCSSVAQYHPAGRKVSLSLIRLYTWQVGHALYLLHQRGLIHRDVKPGNILLLHSRHTLLADFGLVMRDPAVFPQKRLHAGGTMVYMSPEQYRGYPSTASDQYSLATCVYEWLTGHLPFYGETTRMMRRRERFAPLPVSRYRPELPGAIDGIMLTALHRDPARRYPTVLDFARELIEVTRSVPAPLITRRSSYRRSHIPDTADLLDHLSSTPSPRSETGPRRRFSLPALFAPLHA